MVQDLFVENEVGAAVFKYVGDLLYRLLVKANG